MPGGLAAWLDDDEAGTKTKRTRLPRRAGAASSAVIDVDAASPGTAAAGGGKTNRLQAPAENEAWDPFSSKGTREDASQDAFALLRKAAAAAKQRQQPATSTASSTPSPPAWREASSPRPASSWDPFGAPLADGKENRENAFSKLLAAPASQQQHMHKGRSSVGGPGKRTKLNSNSSSGGGSPEGDAAVTRFCECPVCGKRVIIELCSKHLDTECSGLAIGAGPPVPSPGDDPRSAESLPPAPLPSASSALTVPDQPAPRQNPAASVPLSFGSPVGGEKGRSDTDSFAALPPTPAVAVASPTVDDRGRPGNKAECSAPAEGDASSEGAARNPLTPAAATAVAAKSAASNRRKKTSRGAPPALRKGRKGAAAVAAAAAAETKAITTCPVCGKNIQADLCSWHLDHECAGVNPAPEASSSACEGKSTGRDGGNERGAGGGGSEGVAPKKDAGSEATGGLNALAAELTCPVCLCVFEDVHSLPCSHRFCLECILGCFKSSKRQECPLCKIPAWKRDLTRDVSLQNIILAYRRMAT